MGQNGPIIFFIGSVVFGLIVSMGLGDTTRERVKLLAVGLVIAAFAGIVFIGTPIPPCTGYAIACAAGIFRPRSRS